METLASLDRLALPTRSGFRHWLPGRRPGSERRGRGAGGRRLLGVQARRATSRHWPHGPARASTHPVGASYIYIYITPQVGLWLGFLWVASSHRTNHYNHGTTALLSPRHHGLKPIADTPKTYCYMCERTILESVTKPSAQDRRFQHPVDKPPLTMRGFSQSLLSRDDASM